MAEEISAARADGPTLVEQLAAYWSTVGFDDIPRPPVALAKRFLLDTLAAGVAGAHTEVVAATLRAARASSEETCGSARVFGRADMLPAPQAAMVNGTAAHALELDDFGGCGHSGAVVVPTVCALAGKGGVGGRAAIVAMLAGYDLAARVLEGAGGYRRHNDLGWHSTGTCGSFGAAAAAARVLQLDSQRFADALGIAGTFTGGIWAYLVDGAMTKRFHPGKAAENGLTAAMLAKSGMSGPRHVLEAPWGGFFSTYAPGIATPAETVRDLGEDFRIARSGMKPYACCRGLHACLDSLFAIMRETRTKSSDIAGMVVHGNAQVVRQFDRPVIGNLLDAQFSMQYALAAAAPARRATLDRFEPLRLDEPEVRRLMPLIEVVDDRVIPIGSYPPLEVHFHDGRRIEHHTPFAKGAPENPLTDEELKQKVASLLMPSLGAARCGEIMDCIQALESVPDFRTLLDMLVPPFPGSGPR